MNFPLFVVEMDRLPILDSLNCDKSSKVESGPETKTTWRPSMAERPRLFELVAMAF